MPPQRGTSTRAAPQGAVKCPWCPFLADPQGIGSHKRSCRMKPEANIEDEGGRMFDALVGEHIRAEETALRISTASTPAEPSENLWEPEIPSNIGLGQLPMTDLEGCLEGANNNVTDANNNPEGSPEPLEPEMNDILIQFHPNSKREDVVYSHEDFCYADSGREHPKKETYNPLPFDKRPWRPFLTRLDFELAEIMLDTHMNDKQMKSLIEFVHQAIKSPANFNLHNVTDLKKFWDAARKTRTTGFQQKAISVDYKGEKLQYDVWFRPLWSWCSELLRNRELVEQFTWSAERVFKYNGKEFKRFVDEPWTANAWWDFQSRSSFPLDASPFFIVFYADKTRLSSFGTEKGYPVLVRCANLPVEIRNGSGVGGGRLIGWLPIPDDDSSESGKKEYINLKRLIWHTAVHEILSSTKTETFLGNATRCGDGVTRNIFPAVFIISADYEEQAMISLIRGTNSLYPCPICLVPKEDLPILTRIHPLQTTETMRDVYEQAQVMNAGDSENLLKSYGLRDSAVHLLDDLKHILSDLGRDIEAAVDEALNNIQPWSGLNHFSAVKKTGEMADGTKFEDLSKVILFATHHVLTPQKSPEGYLLLRLIRSYLELRMYASLTRHTESMIAYGRAEHKTFEDALKEYQGASPIRAWTFPKAHTHQHMFNDIMRKGATRNYNTKPNEKVNGPLKKYYRNTNFKDVAGQILKISELDLVSTMIWTDIDRDDDDAIQAQNSEDSDADSDAEGEVDGTLAGPSTGTIVGTDVLSQSETPPTKDTQAMQKAPKGIVGNDHFRLGSTLDPITLQEIETRNASNPFFLLFRRRLGQAFTRFLGKRVVFNAQHSIVPYQYVKVFFRSVVDWNIEYDIIRRHPNFHKKERYDFALVKVEDKKAVFMQVQFLFAIELDGVTYYIAMVLPMDIPRSLQNRPRDQHLRLIRVQPRSMAAAVFIHADSIIRGALLENDQLLAFGEYLVVNSVDQDMWMRLNPEFGFTELVTHAVI